MNILAIDTATEACSAALLIGNEMLTRYSEPGRGHAELILPMVDELLNEGQLKLTQLDCIAVGRGPGAFTGIRIAVGVAQGLAYGADLPVVPVSDLAALAQRAAEALGAHAVLACMDARMNEVYWGAFELGPDNLVSACTDEHVTPPEAIEIAWQDDWVGAGTGWAAYPQLATRFRSIPSASPSESGTAVRPPGVLDGSLLPRASEIAKLGARDFRAGRAVAPEQAQPVYLRDRVAWAQGTR